MKKIKDYSLYLVTGEKYNQTKTTLEIVNDAILGGVNIVQMREKEKTQQELIDLGRDLSLLCQKSDVIFIVNDDPILAKQVDADGVHLGQQDIMKYSIDKTRSILGKEKLIGISTHSLEQFEKANQSDCDYLAFGPIFSTKTKDYFIGTDDIAAIMRITKKPVIFIGGINLENADSVLEKGAKNLAVIRSIVGADDIITSTSVLKQRIEYQRDKNGNTN